MVRIVAIADTHTFEEDLQDLPEGDLLVHAGDLCRAGNLEELEGVLRWLGALPHAHKLIVAGNHDGCFQHQREQACALLDSSMTYLEDSGVEIEGLKFWGSPWQPAFNDWAFNLPRGAALAEKWALVPEDVDVLITHAPPAGFGDRVLVEGRAGCEDLIAAVRRLRPALHVFGHIHHDGGLWRDGPSTLVNATTWECERGPSVIDIDETTREVTPVQIPPREA